jgi:hypothetical protein
MQAIAMKFTVGGVLLFARLRRPRNKIGLMSIGSELHITLIRNGASQEVTAVLTEAKAEKRPSGRGLKAERLISRRRCVAL